MEHMFHSHVIHISPPPLLLLPPFCTLISSLYSGNTNPSPMAVGVMDALSRSNREPSVVRTIVIYHVLSPNPQQLMALVQIQLRHRWFVPPILLLPIAAALPSNVRRRHRRRALAPIDLETLVRGYEWRVGPIRLNPTALRRPIIGVPY